MELNKPQKITPFLWFDHQAEEAANFYLSIFNDSKILGMSRYGDAGPGPKGQVMVASFQLAGQNFLALNGGPRFTFNESISFVINCDTQEEIDHYWDHLSAGGSTQACGWLKDKFGVSWQVVPSILGELMQGTDKESVRRVNEVMLKSIKFNIDELRRAQGGNS